MRRPVTEKLSGNQVSRLQRHFVAVVTGVFVLMILWVAAVPLLSWFELNQRVDAMQSASQRWRQNGYPDYEYRMSIDCNCEFRTGGTIAVRVVESAFRSASAALPAVEGFPTSIGESFDFVAALLDRYPDAIEIDYHEIYGHPQRLFVDFDDAVPGDEWTWLITDLRPLVGGR